MADSKEHYTDTLDRYMQGFKCQVTNPGTKQIAKAKPPVWCADDSSKCRKGAKQMIVFNRKLMDTPVTPVTSVQG